MWTPAIFTIWMRRASLLVSPLAQNEQGALSLREVARYFLFAVTTSAIMDRASQTLAESFTADELRSYRAVAEKSRY